MNTIVAMHQDQGDREYQQDAMGRKSFGPAGTLCILADGMGGYEGGEIASQLIIDTFMDMAIDSNDIGAILEKNLYLSNEAILAYKQNHDEVKSMGSTVVAFYISNKSFQWISVGDSPLYVIRGERLDRINQNHSIAGLLELQLKKGEITQKDMDDNPNKHMLTSAMTGEDITDIDLSKEYPLKDNYLFILASDGIETLTENEINEIVQKHNHFGDQEVLNILAKELVDAVLAKKKPHQDNVTVILVSQTTNSELDSFTNMQRKEVSKDKKTSILKGKIPYILISIFLILLYLIWLIVAEIKEPSSPENKINVVDKNSGSFIKSVDINSSEDNSTHRDTNATSVDSNVTKGKKTQKSKKSNKKS